MRHAPRSHARQQITRNTLLADLRWLFRLADRAKWQSHDPYDLLLSPYLEVLQVIPIVARVAVQIGRRTGRRTRLLLKVSQHEDSKTYADYLRAAVALARVQEAWAGEFLQALSWRLCQLAVVESRGVAWGLEFPYSSRFANVPARHPNIYVTGASTRAMFELHELNGDQTSRCAVEAACRYVLDSLGSFEHGGHRWLRYWPGRENPIVNVQASSASLFAAVGLKFADERLLHAADDAAATTLATQRFDGSWPYSADGRADFVDGFHTGFILESLVEYAQWRPERAEEVGEAVDRGFRFFESSLLTPAGLPRAFADGTLSRDPQNVAQCIRTLLSCGRTERLQQALNLWDLLRSEWPHSGDRSGFVTHSSLLSLRWCLGPAAAAGARLLEALPSNDG